MAYQFFETFPSRKSSTGSAERNYCCVGTDDELTVRTVAAQYSPTVHLGLFRNSIDVAETAPEMWEISVKYATKKLSEIGDWQWDFDTSGGKQKITQAKENKGNWAAQGVTPSNFKGAIGVTDSGVEGCEITIPEFKWNEKHNLDAKVVTWTYSQVLRQLTGRTNAATFRGFETGSVLFLGAKGSASNKAPGIVEVSYSFAASEEGNNIQVADITVSHKDAWDYLWVRYVSSKDTNAKKIVKKPTSVHVERVYDMGDFSLLGIG